LKVVAIIQARMSSTRLPGKVLKKVNNETLLEHMLKRVKKSTKIDEIIVATTILESDDRIVDLCSKIGIKTYRGSEENVLSRYYEAAIANHADIIVRLTSDCPLMDPFVIDKCIELYQKDQCDYVSNSLERSYPRGMDVEVFSFKSLETAYLNAKEMLELEHVTPYIYLNSSLFQLKHLTYSSNNSQYRLTVDTEEDLELVSWVINSFGDSNYTLEEILHLLKSNPEKALINAHIEQKKLGD
jgi:spore coat polysaccharide biosynthesis protein SpsF